MAKSLDVDIRFYGRLLDQFDQPIRGADVELGLTCFSPNLLKEWFTEGKRLLVKTDERGAFSVTEQRGRSLSVDRIVKEGYEFPWEQNRMFYYSGQEKKRILVPDEKAPVVFRGRKKGATTFLIRGLDLAMGCHVKDKSKTMGYDFIQGGRIDNPANPSDSDRDLVCDLEVTATFDAKSSTWKLTLRPGQAGGGILASEELLYEAPEAGYAAEYVFVAEGDKRLPRAKYLYLRSREPAIYTRVDIAAVVVAPDFVRLRFNSVTNPYGDRNLEGEPDLLYEVAGPLTDAARAALREKKLPPKPDLPKLIKEAKEKAAQSKAKP